MKLILKTGEDVFYNYKLKKLMKYGKPMVEVDEAIIIKKGKYQFSHDFIREYIREDLQLAGHPTNIKIMIGINANISINAGQANRRNKHRYTVPRQTQFRWQNDNRYDDKWYYEKDNGISCEIQESECMGIIRTFEFLAKELACLSSKDIEVDRIILFPELIMKIIGEGETVTAESFINCLAKGKTEKRIWENDYVTWLGRGKEKKQGQIIKLGKTSANIIQLDGESCTAVYSKLSKTTRPKNDEYKKVLSESVFNNFKESLKNMKFFKDKIVKKKVVEPFFSGNPARERDCVICPNCKYPLAREWKGNNFKCVLCSQIAIEIAKVGDETIFRQFDPPSKNNFNIEEARCCNNCGLFYFEFGRQGKRSTGYCKITNQTVVAHNTCKKGWTPKKPEAYNNILTQHITNLGYGVSDGHNTGRMKQNIKDLVYKKEDHKEQRKLSKKMKGAYRNAYIDFLEKIKDISEKIK